MLVIFILLAHPALATGPALKESSCMPEVMSVIEAAGLLEAQRELIQNQNLLFKPDSVLEYSCFEQHLTLSGERTGQQFSEAEWWFGIDDPFVDQYSLDRAIYNMVFTALIEYLEKNFWHKYLGDRAELTALPPSTSGGFVCYAMGYVWNKAKCMNFITPRKQQDGFYTFDEYKAMQDPRNLPDPQICDDWPDWEDEIKDSRVMSAAVTTTPVGSTAKMDSVNLYTEIFDPENCSEPIPTGLYVPAFPGAGIDGYEEYVCVTPGCHYDGSQCTR